MMVRFSGQRKENMKIAGWIIAAVMTLNWGIDQWTIAKNRQTIRTLEEACAIYYHKLTGEPHPFYHE